MFVMALYSRSFLSIRSFLRPATASSRCIATTSSILHSQTKNSESNLSVSLNGLKILSFPRITPHSPTHGVHVATLHLQAYHPFNLDLMSQFAVHSAHSLGIPSSLPAFLPKEKSLYTVLKSPFVKKKAQENFERRTHKRAVKIYDADREAVDLWLRYLRQNGLPGVGMKAYIHDYVEYGFGRKETEGKNEITIEVEADRIKQAADDLVKALSEGEIDNAEKKANTAEVGRDTEKVHVAGNSTI
ncbi:hypothetical protein L204_104388 [Cryptococcus depauperatus]